MIQIDICHAAHNDGDEEVQTEEGRQGAGRDVLGLRLALQQMLDQALLIRGRGVYDSEWRSGMGVVSARWVRVSPGGGGI